jgi:hypothetical protein
VTAQKLKYQFQQTFCYCILVALFFQIIYGMVLSCNSMHLAEHWLERTFKKTAPITINNYSNIIKINEHEYWIDNKLYDVHSAVLLSKNAISFTGVYDTEELSVNTAIQKAHQHEQGKIIIKQIIETNLYCNNNIHFVFENAIFFNYYFQCFINPLYNKNIQLAKEQPPQLV